MYKQLLLTAACILLFHSLLAQSDTLRLREVTVYGMPRQKFAIGNKVSQFDSLELAQQQGSSLSEFLIRKSPIYFKEYGSGMLATISFRGTSPNHTAVLWNGLNLNAPNLGQTDFSLIPLFATEAVAIQYGGSSALWGSDAIGGTIYLQDTPQWERQLSVKLQQEAGSFGRYFIGIAASAAFQNWSLTSKLYSRQAENDFEYKNTNKKGHPVERNRNARFKQKGFVQNIAYRFSASSSLSLNSWYQHTFRQIQAPMGDLNTQDQQEDKNLNLSLRYKNNSAAGFFDAQFGHLYTYLLYNLGSEYKTWQTIGNLRYEKAFGESVNLEAGAKLNHIAAHIAQYPGGSTTENRGDFFASLRYQPFKKLKTSFNLRQAMVSSFTVPFTPSAGLEYTLYTSKTSGLQWLATGGRNYRIPTLNDRYWQYAGNPNLEPENAWNAETTLKYRFQKSKTAFELNATGYAMWVTNWILWLPTVVAGPEGEPFSTWAPRNIQEVNSKGVELGALVKRRTPMGDVTLGSNLAHTRSINKKAMHEYDRTVGRQLPFVPKIKGNAYLTYLIKSWSFTTNWSFTGIRYTSGEESVHYSVPAYSVVDASLGKALSWQKHTINLAFEARNLMNTPYQNYENLAMPGRSFNLSIKYLFNKYL